MINNSDPEKDNCFVLVYDNDNVIIVKQCNKFQKTTTQHNLEIFDTVEEMESRIEELNLIYPDSWES